MKGASPRPPDARRDPPLFIDRDASSRALFAALEAAGRVYIAHRDHFAPTTPDPDWLRVAGSRGWVVLTRDQNIRRKPNELAAIKDARVVLFVLTSGNLSAEATGRIVVDAYERIMAAARAAPRPAIFSLTREGRVHPLRFR